MKASANHGCKKKPSSRVKSIAALGRQRPCVKASLEERKAAASACPRKAVKILIKPKAAAWHHENIVPPRKQRQLRLIAAESQYRVVSLASRGEAPAAVWKWRKPAAHLAEISMRPIFLNQRKPAAGGDFCAYVSGNWHNHFAGIGGRLINGVMCRSRVGQ